MFLLILFFKLVASEREKNYNITKINHIVERIKTLLKNTKDKLKLADNLATLTTYKHTNR